MNREGEIVVLREHLATVDRLADRLVEVRGSIEGLMPMTGDRLTALAGSEEIHVLAFLKTFEQFEDTLERTLKTIAMVVQFGKKEHLSPRETAQRAVALGILTDGRAWADAVRVRHELAHEYPLDPHKQAAQVDAAWATCATLFDTAQAIRDFIARERLLHGDL